MWELGTERLMNRSTQVVLFGQQFTHLVSLVASSKMALLKAWHPHHFPFYSL